jgi:hypothetical protein
VVGLVVRTHTITPLLLLLSCSSPMKVQILVLENWKSSSYHNGRKGEFYGWKTNFYQ